LRSITVPEVRIQAEPRTEFGKGPARRSRREGKVPAVLYGHGTDTRHLTVPGHDVLLALRTPNVLIRLDGIGGKQGELALPKSVQRDPIRGTVEHVDLILVRRGEKVTVEIPVQVSGELIPDGMLEQQLVQIAVEAEATNIPPGVEVSIDGLQIGGAVHASDLKLPEGVTLAVEPDLLVLHIVAAPTAEQFEAELGETETEQPETGEAPPPVADGSPEGQPEAASE
jgi:large subunit ribosomal protein L25